MSFILTLSRSREYMMSHMLFSRTAELANCWVDAAVDGAVGYRRRAAEQCPSTFRYASRQILRISLGSNPEYHTKSWYPCYNVRTTKSQLLDYEGYRLYICKRVPRPTVDCQLDEPFGKDSADLFLSFVLAIFDDMHLGNIWRLQDGRSRTMQRYGTEAEFGLFVNDQLHEIGATDAAPSCTIWNALNHFTL